MSANNNTWVLDDPVLDGDWPLPSAGLVNGRPAVALPVDDGASAVGCLHQTAALPDVLPAAVLVAASKVDVADRHKGASALVDACVRAGFTREQTCAVLHQDYPATQEFRRRRAPCIGAAGLHSNSLDRYVKVLRAVEQKQIRAEADAFIASEKALADAATLPVFTTLSAALSEPEEPEKWRIADLLPENGNGTLIAPEKVGKTTLVGNLVRSLVDGTPFLGRHQVERVIGRVAVLNYEVTGRMFTRWLGDMGIRNADQVVAMHLRGHRVPLLTEQGVMWLADQLRAVEAEVLIVDPFGAAFRSAGGISESDNTEVGRFLSALDEVKRRAGVAELLMPVHAKREMAEGTERGRGASVLQDWPDTLWTLTKDNQDRRYLSARGRDVAVDEQRLEFDPSTRALTVAGGSRRTERADGARRAVIEVLRATPGRSGRQLEDALVRGDGEHTRTDLNSAVAALIADSTVRTAPGPHNSKLHFLVESSAPN